MTAPIRVPSLPQLGPLSGAEKVLAVQIQGGVPVVGLTSASELAALSASLTDIAFRFASSPDVDEVVDFLVLASAFILRPGMTGSVGFVNTVPVASYVLSLRGGGTLDPASGTLLGTITISTAGAFTFATVSGTDTVVSTGSLLKLVAPHVVDVGISGVAITIKA